MMNSCVRGLYFLCHPRGSGDPGTGRYWINGFTGMMLVMLLFGSANACAADANPAALVQTAMVQMRGVDQAVQAFGTIESGPRQLKVIAAPRASVVELEVAAGMRVTRGTALVTLLPTPDSAVLYAQAKSQADYARSALQRTQSLFKEKLANRDQLAAAQKALADAAANLAAQRQMGGGGPAVIRAPADGVVSAVSVASGARVATDTPLLMFAEQGGSFARLGVTPVQAPGMHAGMPVTLNAAFDPQATLKTRIAQVGGQVDPASGLVDVLVPIAGKSAAAFLPGSNVIAHIIVREVRSLAVPRSAVLRDDRGAYVFVIKNQVAHRVNVQAGIDDGDWIAVRGDLSAGERVVTLGNYELTDGMAVRETAP